MVWSFACCGFGFPFSGNAVVLKVNRWLDGVAEPVENIDVTRRLHVKHFPEGFIAVLVDGVENLQRGEHQAGAMDRADVDVAKVPEEVGGRASPLVRRDDKSGDDPTGIF